MFRRALNMALADESELVGVELRYPDGRAWSGGADFGYVPGAAGHWAGCCLVVNACDE